MMTSQHHRSIANLVALGLQAGESDFEIQERLLAAFPDLTFTEIVGALANGHRRAAAAAAIVRADQRGQ